MRSHELAGEFGCRTHDRVVNQVVFDFRAVVARKATGHKVLDRVGAAEQLGRRLGRMLRAVVKVGELQLVRLATTEGVGDAVMVGVAVGTCGRNACRS